MKKVLNLISLIVLIVGVALLGVALVFADADMGLGFMNPLAYDLLAMVFVVGFVFVGAVLSRIKALVPAKIGRGLLLAGAVVFLGLALYPMFTGGDLYIFQILALVGAALVLIHFIFVLLADKAATTDDDVVVDEKIALIYRYKDLMDDGIITKEEFNAKKAELMAPQAKAKR